MAKARNIVGLVIAVTIAALLFAPIADSVSSNSGTQTVTNETVTADLDNYVDLSGYAISSSSETVYGYNDSSSAWETVPGGDYQMNYGPGEINVSSSSSIVQDGETIRVSYDYSATNSTSTTVLNLIPLLMALLILGILALKAQEMMG